MINLLKTGARVAAFSLLALAGTAQATQTQFIVNGDFSQPVVGSAGYTNTQAIPGWTNLAEQFVEVGNSTVYGLPCINGACQNAEINNTTFGDLVQSVSGLTAGDTYNLQFTFGGRNAGGFQQFDTYFGGQYLGTGSADGVTPFWYTVSLNLIASATTETLEFRAVDTTASGGLLGYGNELTNVSLVGPIPEPATWAMMLAGFAMVGAGLRRRNRSVRVSFG